MWNFSKSFINIQKHIACHKNLVLVSKTVCEKQTENRERDNLENYIFI